MNIIVELTIEHGYEYFNGWWIDNYFDHCNDGVTHITGLKGLDDADPIFCRALERSDDNY